MGIELGGALASLAGVIVGLLLKLAGFLAVVWIGVHGLKIIAAGGEGRATGKALFGLLGILLALGALIHWQETLALLSLAGGVAWQGVSGALREALQAG